MQFTGELPDELVERLVPEGSDPVRLALEDMAVEACRAPRLTDKLDDLNRDLETHRRLGI